MAAKFDQLHQGVQWKAKVKLSILFCWFITQDKIKKKTTLAVFVYFLASRSFQFAWMVRLHWSFRPAEW